MKHTATSARNNARRQNAAAYSRFAAAPTLGIAAAVMVVILFVNNVFASALAGNIMLFITVWIFFAMSAAIALLAAVSCAIDLAKVIDQRSANGVDDDLSEPDDSPENHGYTAHDQ